MNVFPIVRFAIPIVGSILLSITAHAADAAAKPAPPPAYKNLRFEEDWSKLSAEGSGSAFDPIKKLAISDGSWLSFGGSARVRYEHWENFGFAENNDDDFLLHRAFLHTDLHLGPHWRFFFEGRFSDVNHRDLPGAEREALDFDKGDLWNAFIEAKYPVGGTQLTVRLGRQELEFGKQRLVSPLDWSNNRRIFEGVLVRVQGTKSPWQLDAFVTRPVIIDGDQLSWNHADDDTLFSGLHFTTKLGAEKKYTLDTYFFAQNAYDSAVPTQDRYTLGARAAGPIWKNLTFEAEAAYQFGRRDYTGPSPFPIGSEDISAWMLTAEATYTFAGASWAPWITAGVDYASGDQDRMDGDSQTFAQLYPLGHAFLGYVDAVGRQNIIDARFSAGAWPIPKKLKIWGDFHWFWRADDDDALYNAGGAVQRAATYVTTGGRTVVAGDRYVGAEVDLTMTYQFTRYTTWLLGYGHFFAGEFIDTTGPHEDLDFVYSSFEFKF
jgi:hypothetical protein